MTDENKRTVDFIERVKQLLHDYETCSTFSMYDVMRGMPQMSEGDVDLFLTACLHQRQHGCLVLAAVCYQRIEQMLSFKAFELAQHSTALFWTDVFYYLSSSRRFHCLARLLGEESLFQMLVEHCSRSDMSLLREVVDVVSNGLAPQFKRLVYSDDERVRQVVLEGCFEKGHFVYLVVLACVYRQQPSFVQGEIRDFNSILGIACEAGLYMDSVPSIECSWLAPGLCTPFSAAVYSNEPDVVRFLYSFGTVSNHEVFQLSRNPELIKRLESNTETNTDREDGQANPPAALDVKAARDILSFLQTKASQPRSLESRCLQVVSRQLGWGHVRKANVEHLKIPNVVKDVLNFKHNGELF